MEGDGDGVCAYHRSREGGRGPYLGSGFGFVFLHACLFSISYLRTHHTRIVS